MQVATWNVNSIRTRQQQVAAWLQEHPVEVLCLQETKVPDADFPRAPFEALGYHTYVLGQKANNGVAILSRTPADRVLTGFSSVLEGERAAELDAQKRAIAAEIAGICIVNLYVPNGASVGSDKYDYKLRWLAALRDYLQQLRHGGNAQLCVCGDFNVAPESRDIHDPRGKDTHIMASPAEREALQSVLALGLGDAFRKFTAEGGHYSWWDYRTRAIRGNRGWRIDHCYLSPELYQRARDCYIDAAPRRWERPSDHAPVVVAL